MGISVIIIIIIVATFFFELKHDHSYTAPTSSIATRRAFFQSKSKSTLDLVSVVIILSVDLFILIIFFFEALDHSIYYRKKLFGASCNNGR